MKREFLENLGLDRGAVDAVMSENGKSIEALREKCRLLEEEAAELKLRLSEKDALLSEKTALLSELEEDKSRFSEFRDTVIKKAAKDAGFSSQAAENAAVSLMRQAADSGKDFYSVLSCLRESDPGAFVKDRDIKPIFSLPASGNEGAENAAKLSFIRRRA